MGIGAELLSYISQTGLTQLLKNQELVVITPVGACT